MTFIKLRRFENLVFHCILLFEYVYFQSGHCLYEIVLNKHPVMLSNTQNLCKVDVVLEKHGYFHNFCFGENLIRIFKFTCSIIPDDSLTDMLQNSDNKIIGKNSSLKQFIPSDREVFIHMNAPFQNVKIYMKCRR